MGTAGSSWAQTRSSQIAAVLHTTFKNDHDAFQERIAMVTDGTSWHRSDQLKAPANVYLLKLPPYAPELNPIEHVWGELREKFFHNRVFKSLDALEDHPSSALKTSNRPSPDGLQST